MATEHRVKKTMTPEQQTVIDRVMTGALKAWDADLIKGAVESGAHTQELLIQAIAKKSPDFVKLALHYGADAKALVPAGGKQFQPVLHYAHDNFHEEIFNIILAQNVPIDLKNPQGETVAQRAARAGDFERMRWYLAKGADLSGSVQDILVKAVDKKDLAAMQWSIDQGADVQCRVRDGDTTNTLLHQCLANFREDVAEFLLRQGIPVDARNSAGETVLHLAARQGETKKVEYLLKKGADPLAASYAGVSVLDEAMKNVSDRDDYEYRYSSSSKSREAKAVMGLLLARVKEVYGIEPFTAAVQRDITVSKPINVAKGPRDDASPKSP
jgi:hypothetical protein